MSEYRALCALARSDSRSALRMGKPADRIGLKGSTVWVLAGQSVASGARAEGAAASPQAALLREAGLPAGTAEGGKDLAVDLGCGPGPQSLALARLGYAPVFPVDTGARPPDELTTHAAEAGLA
ncbi:hypothetical protein [Streptomyces puniciscabiei]|uniref:hypothetical protein n=1 Tax=Streptomyces puniciscabiei TaxID=164348 RepID=UPI0006EB58B3|nr:hypothetical protein [Streptomyces puniciscabiei]